MKRLVSAFLLLVFASGAVHAEEMRVRAGEHGDFTRLVLAFDQLPGWSAGRTEAGYAIEFADGPPLQTDLSRAFALIDRARIGEIDVDRQSRRVDVSLACDCHAEIFDLNGVTLVIDVRDGAVGPNASHETALEEEASQRGQPPILMSSAPALADPAPPRPRRISGGQAEAPPPRRIQAMSLSAPVLVQSGETQQSTLTTRGSRQSPQTVQLPIPQPTLPTIDFLPTVNSSAVQALTEQLGRAASQGLIQVAPSSDGQERSNRLPIDGPRNFRVFTGVDRATGAISAEAGATIQGSNCIPDALVDVGRWGDPKNAAKLGTLRQGIVRETGATDLDAMMDLARYYVALGFGAEARFAALQLPDSDERAILLALSEIVDHGESDAELFAGQLACPGKIALWAALSGPFRRADLPISTDVILTTFSALPPHLREHLGPFLSQRLRNAGETALARAALGAVSRVGSGSVGQELTAARLELLGTRAQSAREDLERIAQGTNVEAAEALIELLQDARRRKVPPKPEWVDDAGTLIRVTNGTRTAEELSIASLRGRIPLGRFDELRRALSVDQPGLDDVVRRDISTDALTAAVRDADSATFIRTELGLSDFAAPDALDSSVRYEMVARFLELGLPRFAAKYLPETAETPSELRLTASTISALERRREALTILNAAPDEKLADLRAELLGSLREFPEASALLVEIGEERAAELQALRSGDWAWIAERGPANLAQTVRDAIAPAVTADDPRRNSTLISDVSGRRAAYLELLDRTQPIRRP